MITPVLQSLLLTIITIVATRYAYGIYISCKRQQIEFQLLELELTLKEKTNTTETQQILSQLKLMRKNIEKVTPAWCEENLNGYLEPMLSDSNHELSEILKKWCYLLVALLLINRPPKTTLTLFCKRTTNFVKFHIDRSHKATAEILKNMLAVQASPISR